jgi:ATP-dependent RNA helicase RhlE
VIIACPGRLLDHLSRNTAKLDQVEVLVLDEADRMLDMGFVPSIREIIRKVPVKRQTLLFSATFSRDLEELIRDSLSKPKRIAIGIETPAATVAHALYPVAQHLKTNLVVNLLQEMQAQSVLLFTRTKHRADRVADQIGRAGFRTAALHANKSQNQRKQALDGFRIGKVQILVATDIAARGLDIAGISHVINFDVPDSAVSYIHRIGRTGRAERSGAAVTLMTPEDKVMVREIEKVLGRSIERRTVEGFNYDENKKSDNLRSKPQGLKPPRPAFWSEKETRAKKRDQRSSKDRRWENFYQAA